jgi:hypothetical protein
MNDTGSLCNLFMGCILVGCGVYEMFTGDWLYGFTMANVGNCLFFTVDLN